MTTPLIEAIAGSIRFTPHNAAECREAASLVLTAITEAGYAVVPVEPTDAMMEIIREASDDCCDYWLTRAATCSYDIELMFKKAVIDAISAAQGDGA